MKAIIAAISAAFLLVAVLATAGATTNDQPDECAPETILEEQVVGTEYKVQKQKWFFAWYDYGDPFWTEHVPADTHGVRYLVKAERDITEQVEIPNPDYDPECGQEPTVTPTPTESPTPTATPTESPTPDPEPEDEDDDEPRRDRPTPTAAPTEEPTPAPVYDVAICFDGEDYLVTAEQAAQALLEGAVPGECVVVASSTSAGPSDPVVLSGVGGGVEPPVVPQPAKAGHGFNATSDSSSSSASMLAGIGLVALALGGAARLAYRKK